MKATKKICMRRLICFLVIPLFCASCVKGEQTTQGTSQVSAKVHEEQQRTFKTSRLQQPRSVFYAADNNEKHYLPHKKKIESLMWPWDFKQLYNILNFAESGKTQSWYNPRTQITYRVMARDETYPVSDMLNAQPCRVYKLMVLHGSYDRDYLREACRKLDRTWYERKV